MTTNAFNVLQRIQILLNTIMPLLIAIAAVWFIWGVITYVISGDEDKKKTARGHIIQGLIGLFIILSFWGIVALINNTLGINPVSINPSAIPCIPAPGVIC